MAGFSLQNLNPFNGGRQPGQQPQQQPQQQQFNPQASQQQQQGPANSQFQNPQGTPTGGQGNPAPQSQNPLDDFKSVFGFDRQQQQQGNQPQQMQQPQQQQAPQAPAYDGYTQPFDIAQARTRMSNVKFSAQLPEELRQKIAAGDTSAFFDALDHVGREAFLHSTQMAHQFVDRGVKTGLDRFGNGLDERFRDYEVRNQNPDNDALRHPTVAPMFGAMKQMIAQNNPGMSASEVASMAQKYFTQLSAAMNPQQGQQGNSQTQSQETDWAASFGVDSPEPQQAQQQFQPQQGGNFAPRGF